MASEQSSEGRIKLDLKIDSQKRDWEEERDRFLVIGVNWNGISKNVRRNIWD